MAKSSKQEWIYESPDHGTTVYRRRIGDLHYKRELVDQSVTNYVNVEAEVRSSTMSELKWRDIQKQAEDHPALQAALDHVIMIYTLSKEEDDNDEDLPF
jgi:hypothetical protein